MWTFARLLFGRTSCSLQIRRISEVRVPLRRGLQEKLKLEFCYGLTECSQEGPWYVVKYFARVMTHVAADPAALAWRGINRFATLVFQAGANLNANWLDRGIHVIVMYAFYYVLAVSCRKFPCHLARAQVLVNAHNIIVVQNFRKGRGKDECMNRLRCDLFDVLAKEMFWLWQTE